MNNTPENWSWQKSTDPSPSNLIRASKHLSTIQTTTIPYVERVCSINLNVGAVSYIYTGVEGYTDGLNTDPCCK